MANCVSCNHSMFCDTWGEYICSMRGSYISNPKETVCEIYKPITEDRPKHQCEDCLNREKEE